MSKRDYHPAVLWDTIHLAAEREDYLMVGLATVMFCLSPVVCPMFLGVELFGRGVGALLRGDSA